MRNIETRKPLKTRRLQTIGLGVRKSVDDAQLLRIVVPVSANRSYPNDRHYRTAQATVSCKLVKAGEFVSVEFLHETDGVPWFTIRRSLTGERGRCDSRREI